MDINVIKERMILASKEDRERFFRVADAIHLQPKYAEHLTELEKLKQMWRDMTDLPGYPDIDFPLVLPSWFPRVNFASCWKVGHLKEMMDFAMLENKFTLQLGAGA